MSKRSKRRRKKKQRIGVPIVPPPQSQPMAAKPSKHALILTIAGLVLAAIGLVTLIELFPRLSTTATPPTDSYHVLTSSTFTITNDGYLRVTDVMAACYLWRVDQGDVHFRNTGIIRAVAPLEGKLAPTEGYTVPCSKEDFVTSTAPSKPIPMTHADLAIIVYYRPWPFTILRTRRLFRFIGRFGEGGQVAWDKQPADQLEPDFDKWIEMHGGTFPPTPPSRPHFP